MNNIEKVKLYIVYKYFGEELGAIPYIKIGYIDFDNRETDALERLYEKDLNTNKQDGESKDIEIRMKQLAKEFMVKGIEAGYCIKTNNGYISSSTDDLVSNEFNDALVSGIGLNSDISLNENLSIDDKILLLTKVFINMYGRVKKNNIGFGVEKVYDDSRFDFEIDGLNLELFKDLPNLENVVCTVMKNHILKFNQRVNSQFKTQEIGIDQHQK